MIFRKRDWSLVTSFKYASRGLRDALREETNLRIHLLVAVTALILAGYLRFNFLEWIILILTISLVFSLELINTTLETLTDIVSPEIKEKARIAKDVSAAGVMLAAFTAVIIGALLYLPKIL